MRADSQMSDECLITLETVFSYYSVCQAVTRKFTLAGKAYFSPVSFLKKFFL